MEVAYAAPDRQWLIPVTVAPGTTAREAIALSGILEKCPDIDTSSIGIFGEAVEHDHRLEAGDRVEIYRPLTAEPKEVRRAMAKLGRTVGRRR